MDRFLCTATRSGHRPSLWPRNRLLRCRRRGLTLLEALLATAVLLIVVTAVMSALSAGTAQSQEARRGVSATLACEMLMARITGVNSDEFTTDEEWFRHFTDPITGGGWDGHAEPTGDIRAGREPALPLLPTGYQAFSLHVDTNQRLHLIPSPISAAISGVEIAVESRDGDRSLTRIVRFLPLPRALAEVSQ
jgi:type II secretory pathway pseudopilin PulG